MAGEIHVSYRAEICYDRLIKETRDAALVKVFLVLFCKLTLFYGFYSTDQRILYKLYCNNIMT